MRSARKKTRVVELEDEVADLKQRLASSEDQVRRLQSSEAALREAISSARSSLRLIDVATFPNQSRLPSPPASTPAQATADDEFADMLNDTASPSMSYESEHSQSSALETISDSPQIDVRAVAFRDENTGLTLGLPLSGHPPLDTMFHFWDDEFRECPSLCEDSHQTDSPTSSGCERHERLLDGILRHFSSRSS